MSASDVRLVAFFLPQFHPIPENDAWWGRGFTEWTNVSAAQPLFRGHQQPHRPADLGYYDLRLGETREAQAELARTYGIDAFCYYHYWFHGRRLLERPVAEMLESGRPDYPFCLCWANENWTRLWDGNDSDLLIGQTYSPEDDRRHAEELARIFCDDRYLRVDGRPIFLLYRIRSHENARRFSDSVREACVRSGAGDPWLCCVEGRREERTPPGDFGFDAAVEFQPDWIKKGRLRKKRLWPLSQRLGLSERAYQKHRIYDYATFIERNLAQIESPYRRYPCVFPGWDNTARRAGLEARIVKESSPELFERWLAARIDTERKQRGEGLVFINAWNEWAEGCHLEPCKQWGHRMLEAVRAAKARR